MNLGTYDDFSPSIKFGDTYCPTTSWSAHTAIQCLSVPGTGIGVGFAITLGPVVGTGLALFSYDSPSITMVERNNSPATAGTTVTLQGTNFGRAGLSQTAIVGLTACQTTSYITSTSVSCVVPQGAGSYIQASLEVNNNIGTKAATFSYDAPIVTYVNRFNAPATSGAVVTIAGFNYGFEDFTPSVRLGTTMCATSGWTSLTTVTCTSATGQGVALGAVVIVDSTSGTMVSAYSYDAPILSDAAVYNAPTSAGMSVTVTGLNFLPTDYTSTAVISTAACETTSWTSTSGVSCLSPSFGGASLPVEILISGNSGTGFNIFSFDSPVFTAGVAQYQNTAATAGNMVTLQGTNFGNVDLTSTVSIGETACSTTVWTTQTTVICTASPGTGARSLKAAVHSLIGTGYMAFTYDTAVISHAESGNSPSSGAAVLTVSGLNFAAMDNTHSVNLGSFPCATVSWTSSTGLTCPSSTGNGAGLATAVLHDLFGTSPSVFTYDSPVMTVASPSNTPTTGAGDVTVYGLNFGMTDRTPSVHLGATVCMTTVWTADSSVKCVPAFGTGGKNAIAAIVTGVIGTMHIAFSYDSPVMSNNEIQNAALTSGASLTVFGVNFAVNSPSATLYVGKTACQTSAWATATSVSCLVSSGSGASLNIVMDVNGQIGSKTGSFTYDAPATTVVAMRNGPATGSATVTMHGTNFGLSDVSASVRIGSTSCSSSEWLSDSAVRCVLASGSGAMLNNALTVDNVAGTHDLSFTYDAPSISFVSMSNAPTTGRALISLSGSNFGSNKLNPVSEQYVQLGGSVCSSNFWISSTSIVCSAAFGVGQALNANVVVSSITGTGITAFTYDSPVVTYVSRPNAATSGGSSLTIRGQNFGPADYSLTIAIGGTACKSSHWRTDSIIVCQVSAGMGAALHSSISIEGIVGTGATVFTYDSPLVTQTDDVNGPTLAGTLVTVYGVNFGTEDGSVTANIGMTSCASSIWVANSMVKCLHPSGAGPGMAAGMDISGLKGCLASAFTYDAPAVTFAHLSSSISPTVFTNGPTTEQSYSVTLSGINFGTSSITQTITFGGRPCDTTSWNTYTSVVCNSRAGSGSSRVALSVDQVVGTGFAQFTYDGPVITNLRQPNTAAAAGGSVTVNGFNFGATDFSIEARLGSSTCSTLSWTSSTELACLAFAGTGMAQSVQVSLSDTVGTGFQSFTFDSPVPTYSTVSNNPTTGGGYVTLHGFNFGIADVSGTAGIVPGACVSTIWASDTSVACMAPGGTGRSSLTVTITGQVGTIVMSFTYDSPSITRLHVPNVPSTSGATVTLMGTNFGPAEPSATVKIAESQCSTTYWMTATQMVCAVKVGVGSSKAITLEVNGLPGTFFLAFSYDSPIVTQAGPLNMPVTVGSSVTVTGTNFGAQDSSFQVAIGSTVCLSSAFVSTTTLKCAPTPGAGAGVSAYVVGSVGSNPDKAYEFSYDSPVVSYAGSVTNGPTSGGNTITILGMNFGASEVLATRAGVIALSECKTTVWTSDSSVKCEVPDGIGNMRHIALVYEKNIGTLVAAFNYDAPVVTHLDLPNAPTAGGAQLTIHGLNLGSPNPYAGTTLASLFPSNSTRAYIENDNFDAFGTYIAPTYKACATTTFVTSSTIVCTAPSGSGAARGVQVIVEGTKVVNQGISSVFSAGDITGMFSYDDPVLTQIVPSNGPVASGATLTMFGMNFGQSSSSQQLYLGTADSPLKSSRVQFVSDSSIVAAQPPYVATHEAKYGTGFAKELTLVVDSHSKTSKISKTFEDSFTFDSPVVLGLGVTPNIPPTGGTSITIRGSNFGEGNSQLQLSAIIGDTACATTSWVSNSLLTCVPQSGVGNMHEVVVGLNKNYGTLANAFTYDAPVVTYVEGASTESSGTTTVVIYASNLGVGAGSGRRSGYPPIIAPGTPLVSIGDEYCQTAQFTSDTSLSCVSLVAGNPAPQIVSVTLAGNVNTFAIPFQFGTRCPNECYASEGRGTCSNGVCQCSTVPGTNRVYRGRDCSIDYCLSNEELTSASGIITDHTEKTYFYLPWYRTNDKCSWTINPNGNGRAGSITLNLEKVDINPLDRLVVYDGKDSTANILAILTGQQDRSKLIPSITGTAGSMFVSLETTTTTSTPTLRRGYTGFQAKYTSAPEGCPLGCSAALKLGKCVNGQCVCNEGWRGAGCNIGYAALEEDGAEMDTENWDDMRGGVVYRTATFQFGCGAKPDGGDNFWFEKKGERYIKSNALNFHYGGYVSFYIKVGSGATDCEMVDPGEEVQLQYSRNKYFNDSTVVTLGTYAADSFQNFRLVEVPVPASSPDYDRSSVYIRWIQPKHDFVRYMDTWALDDIKVVTPFVCEKGADGSFCSGKGTCVATNVCSCYDGFIGGACGAACYWNYWHEKECGCPVPLETLE